MAKQQRTKLSLVPKRRLRPLKSRADEAATWNQNDAIVRVRDLEDRHLMNTLHFVERKLAEYDRVYPNLLKEARFRGLLVRQTS